MRNAFRIWLTLAIVFKCANCAGAKEIDNGYYYRTGASQTYPASTAEIRSKHEASSEESREDLGQTWWKAEELLNQGRYVESIMTTRRACPSGPIDSHGKALKVFMCLFMIGRGMEAIGEYAEAQSLLLASRKILEAMPEEIKKAMPGGSAGLEIGISNTLVRSYFGQGLQELAEKERQRLTASLRVRELPNWSRAIEEANNRIITCKTAQACIKSISPVIDQLEEIGKERGSGEDTLLDRDKNIENALISLELNLAYNFNTLGESKKTLAIVSSIEKRLTRISLPQSPTILKRIALEKAVALNGENRFSETIEYLSGKVGNSRAITEKEIDAALSLEMAHAYIALGDEEKAESNAIEAIRLKSELAQEVIQTLPMNERYQYSRKLVSLDGIYPFALNSQAGLNVALLAKLNEDGIITELDKRQLAGENNRALMTGTIDSGTAGASEIKQKKDRIAMLQSIKIAKLQPTQVVTSEAIAEELPKNTALILYKKYYQFNPTASLAERWGAGRYMALIIKSDKSKSVIDLGSEEEVNELISRALSISEQNNSDSVDSWLSVAAKVLDPITTSKSLGNRILVVPDGELNRVPFSAISLMRNDDLEISLLSSGRSLLTPSSDTSVQRQEPLILAAPEYDNVTEGQGDSNYYRPINKVNNKQNPLGHRGKNEKNWKNLPGALKEGEIIYRIIGGRLETGDSVNHELLKKAKSPVILHFAAHAFFLGEPDNSKGAVRYESSAERYTRSLTQSGIVLSGSNSDKKSRIPNSRYLTALDASYLSLQGTELVVISGCESGLGSIRIGEGVYGLGRAFNIAGSRSVLVSLWKIDDAATAEFMSRFYRRLKSGESRITALLSTQKEFRDGIAGNGEWREPYYWAAWQLIGDSSSIENL